MADQSSPPGDTEDEDADPVYLWRFRQLRRAGYDVADAMLLADSEADLHRAVLLLQDGCPPHLAVDILI